MLCKAPMLAPPVDLVPTNMSGIHRIKAMHHTAPACDAGIHACRSGLKDMFGKEGSVLAIITTPA